MSNETEPQPITWAPKLVKLEELRANPSNPKVINEIGEARLKVSLGKWGMADTIVANLDFTIINGHSRKRELLELGVEETWVMFPSRLLTQKEYDEMNAVFDLAKEAIQICS